MSDDCVTRCVSVSNPVVDGLVHESDNCEVCLSLPWSWGVESNLSFGFFGVVEMGSAVVVEPGLAGLL